MKFLDKEHSISNTVLIGIIFIAFAIGIVLERKKVFTSWKNKEV
jgi:hypothetical protein